MAILILSLVLMPVLLPLPATAQPNFEVQITHIDRTIYKNFVGIPKSIDYEIIWRVMENRNGTMVETSVNKLSNFELLYTEGDSTFREAKTIRVGQVDSCKINRLQIGKKYYFRVQAVDANHQIYQSQVAWMQSGKPVSLAAVMDNEEKGGGSWLGWLPISGRFPLALLNYGDVFDKSTVLGKMSFHCIWWFFVLGFIIIGICMHQLSLSRIFPFTPVTMRSRLSLFRYESTFQLRKKPEFFGENGIIDRWKKIIDEVGQILDRPPKMEGDKNLDFEKLKIHSATMWRDHGRVQIKQIIKDAEAYSSYPTTRIICAGLANHEANGFKFMEASEEVDRAIENRAMMELEQLKGNMKLEWLWNFGAMAPLLGLFGTVTGISVAFKILAIQSEKGMSDTASRISALAGGINEALWTTIFGLTAGIILVLFYYYFKNKLDWIYGKWEEIYVDISEKL